MMNPSAAVVKNSETGALSMDDDDPCARCEWFCECESLAQKAARVHTCQRGQLKYNGGQPVYLCRHCNIIMCYQDGTPYNGVGEGKYGVG